MVFGGGGCDAVVSTDFSGHDGHDKKRIERPSV